HPGDAGAGEHRLLHRQLLRGAAVEPPADLGVLALVVLPHHHEVQFPGADSPQWTLDAAQQHHWAQVDVLGEAAAQRDQQAPQGYVVGHPGVAHRAEKDGVEVGELIHAVGRHHRAGPGVALATPVELPPLEGEPVPLARAFQHPAGGGDHLLADAVAGDHRDPVGGGHSPTSCGAPNTTVAVAFVVTCCCGFSVQSSRSTAGCPFSSCLATTLPWQISGWAGRSTRRYCTPNRRTQASGPHQVVTSWPRKAAFNNPCTITPSKPRETAWAWS